MAFGKLVVPVTQVKSNLTNGLCVSKKMLRMVVAIHHALGFQQPVVSWDKDLRKSPTG